MKEWQKFLLQLQGSGYYQKIVDALQKYERDDLANLDIKKISGSQDLRRIRVGKYRILLKKNTNGTEIIRIGTREGFYQ